MVGEKVNVILLGRQTDWLIGTADEIIQMNDGSLIPSVHALLADDFHARVYQVIKNDPAVLLREVPVQVGDFDHVVNQTNGKLYERGGTQLIKQVKR